jgi:hypothetical protein
MGFRPKTLPPTRLPAFAVVIAGAFLMSATAAQERVQFQASTGPVTVVSTLPEELPNTADYQVKVANFDRNGDRQISRSEVPLGHALASEFRLVDRNRNGRITETELANWR